MRDNLRTALLTTTCLLGLLSVACLIKSDENEMRPIGPTVQADILVYLNSNLSHEEVNSFIKTVLSRPHPEGRGDANAPGVRTQLALRPVEGHEGIALTFFPNASKEQREELLRSIRASPLVYRVLENTAPDSVTTLK
jgi:hypothetical protein